MPSQWKRIAVLSITTTLLLQLLRIGGSLFRVSGDDPISLMDTANETIASVGPLPDTNSDFDVTYAWNVTDRTYFYTTTPIPGTSNIITPMADKSLGIN
jgi:hypothetical protein